MIKNVLSIAGSDPSGGAGIQADLKAFAANKVFGMAAITALTAQNTQGVSAMELMTPAFVRAQIEAVFSDIRVDAVKIGMVGTAEIATAIAQALADHGDLPIVLDPVMMAKGGAPLIAENAMEAIREMLVPIATVVTPNLPEAAKLVGKPEAKTRADMITQAADVTALGPQATLIKGGHLNADISPDVLMVQGTAHWFEAPRTDTKNTHGTGCSLSSALAAHLSQGHSIETAARAAKSFVTEAIATADQLTVGHGHGPIHHFNQLWKQPT